jgi:hypothetical protein
VSRPHKNGRCRHSRLSSSLPFCQWVHFSGETESDGDTGHKGLHTYSSKNILKQRLEGVLVLVAEYEGLVD